MSLGAIVGELHFGRNCEEPYVFLKLLVQENGNCNKQEAFGYMLQNPNTYIFIHVYIYININVCIYV